MRIALAFALAVQLATAGAARAGGTGAQGFSSGGVPITVERFDPPSGGTGPGVLLLHGADGLSRAEVYRGAARLVAGAGYRVFFVHYLDRTGERRASFGTIQQNYPAWAETVRGAVTYVSGQPGVDPRRVGVIGLSLGGALGMTTAAGDARVKALVNFFGFVPAGLAGAGRLPPTLTLHGAADAIVPVQNAYTLDALLKARGVEHETVVYPGQGHGLFGEAQLDSARRAVAFLDRHLR